MSRQETWPAGMEITHQGETCNHALVIQSGTVRLSRQVGANKVPIALLGPGDILSAECLFNDPPLNYNAVAVDDTEGVSVTLDDYRDAVEQNSEWLQRIIRNGMERERVAERPVRSSLSTLYGIGILLYTFLRLKTEEEDLIPRMSLASLLDELINTLPLSRGFIHPVLNGLSHVGLVDLKLSDPYSQSIELPNESLLLGFLNFIQRASDMHSGLLTGSGMPMPAELSGPTSDLLDHFLTMPEYSERLFNPSRALVHLQMDKILENIRETRGDQFDLEKAFSGLEKWSVVKRMKDGGQTSVFLDLRAMLRLNILRDPEANYIDIIEFLLGLMYESRFPQPRSVPNQV
ncbi:MAG: cyclic nucleotide-binding domain-containing protein [bacterium]